MAVPEALKQSIEPITVVTGHYGVGKTNLVLNMALDLAEEGLQVRVIDLDIVNPYFRSSEYQALLGNRGVSVVTPVMANSSLDTPSLSAAVDGTLEWARQEKGRVVLVDVGGDDAGATALGRYADRVSAGPYALVYVVNAYRNLTQSPEEATAILREIEAASHLQATAVVNNSHLRTETTADTLAAAQPFGAAVAQQLALPLVARTTPIWCTAGIDTGKENGVNYPIQMLVKTPWE